MTPPFRPDAPAIGRWHAGGVSAALAGPGTPADALADRLVAGRLGGTFWVPPAAGLPSRYVLALGPERLAAAQTGGDGPVVLVAPCPGSFPGASAVVAGAVDPWALLDGAVTVYGGVDHPLAQLAVLAGVPTPGIHTSRAALASAALVDGVAYHSPFTGLPIDAETALDIVAEWARIVQLNRGIGALTGMAFWKRRRMQAFFHDGMAPPPHRRSTAGVLRAAGARGVAAWSSRMPPGLVDRATDLLRVEDGFVRSAGLGSGFLPPASVIADRRGIYYDPSRPSDLEALLQETVFDPALLHRAGAVMARMVAEGVTKYGSAASAVAFPEAGTRTRILVPGQVADDLSVRLGGAGVAGNADLLARVRAANPGAYVIYKPHPDVDAGHRTGAVPDDQARIHADLVLRGAPMAATIEAVDEVHTLTSLAGYEALLRGRRVVVHGQPFYAGWGLTHDLAPIPRRTRRLTIEQLTAGLLLRYARYVDPVTELPCPVETVLDRLATRDAWPETPLMRVRRWQGAANAWLQSKRA